MALQLEGLFYDVVAIYLSLCDTVHCHCCQKVSPPHLAVKQCDFCIVTLPPSENNYEIIPDEKLYTPNLKVIATA